MGNLYIVATPIGNLEDITYRAVRILGEVDLVFAEDTRTTQVLLKKYGINTKLVSYNSHNQEEKNKYAMKLLEEGKNVALVSDAGTPGVSDPGYSLVNYMRRFLPKAKIASVPGASALTAFLSVAGVGTHAFTFYGFLPQKNGRQKLIKEMYEDKKSSIFYESTHRLIKLLEETKKIGENTRRIAIGKELTKIYEEVLIGTPEELLEIFKNTPSKAKGEFVIMIV